MSLRVPAERGLRPDHLHLFDKRRFVVGGGDNLAHVVPDDHFIGMGKKRAVEGGILRDADVAEFHAVGQQAPAVGEKLDVADFHLASEGVGGFRGDQSGKAGIRVEVRPERRARRVAPVPITTGGTTSRVKLNQKRPRRMGPRLLGRGG